MGLGAAISWRWLVSSYTYLGTTDPYIRLFQLLAVLVVVGSVHALWSAAMAWKRREAPSSTGSDHGYRPRARGPDRVVVNYNLLAIHLNY